MIRTLPLLQTFCKECSKFTKNPNRIVQAVSIDAMGTLIALAKPFDEVYSRVASEHGVDVSPAAIACGYAKLMNDVSESYPCFGYGSIGEYEWWKRIIVGSLQKAHTKRIDHIQGDKISRQLYDFYTTASAWRIIDPEMKSAVDVLRQMGLGVVVVSNFDSRLKKILRNLEIDHLFDLVLLSGEIGLEKPDPKIFEMVLGHYHLTSPSQLLHVGDNVKKDYQAAIKFGAKAFLFDPLSEKTEVDESHRIRSFSELTIE
ncbi:unnamed protein product [Cylicocyclus nassatus]|uniref:Haloacid dehalogenase-like hydrolase domain-containing protein 3 n=1 Tax=Cylicocyclus nassatus TaxID=53992 RepID=A0AA36GYD2_CYLNA|nr:unnamed protein product [Cylicocyclus nassatus]